jgi:SAM-dependent methyltransferase
MIAALREGAVGLGRRLVKNLIELKRRGLLDNCRRVVEIGAQQINDRLLTAPELPDLFQAFGVADTFSAKPVGPENFTAQAPPGRVFWSALGLDSRSVDIADGAIRIDLNRGRVPFRHRAAFDLSVNCGTTEHIANQGNAFAAIHDLVRPGGLMYHQLPCTGHVEHGFFSYHPKFFFRLAASNDYEIVNLNVLPDDDGEIPPEIRERNERFGVALGDRVGGGSLQAVLLKRSRRRFSMPMDR